MELTRRPAPDGSRNCSARGACRPTNSCARSAFIAPRKRNISILSPDARGELDAYVAGVNAWLAQRSVALPPEYYLLRARPEPWRPADSLVWGKLMSLQLAGNFRDELLRARILRHIKPEELAVLYPALSQGRAELHGRARRLAQAASISTRSMRRCRSSSARPMNRTIGWSTASTPVSGKPMLANDPHLPLNAPGAGIWRISRRRRWMSPASPRRATLMSCWATTRISPGASPPPPAMSRTCSSKRSTRKDPTHYLTPTGSAAVRHPRRNYRGAGAAPVKLTVRETRHGPVISDLGGKYAATADAGTVLALQTTWLMPDDRSPEALRGINYAANWTEFRDAMKLFTRAGAEHGVRRRSPARSASSRRRAFRSAARATATCRCRAGAATTIGTASSRSTICRKA